ncbi:hypothetical protein CDAR_93831 [Caerostris darwini]|uniref:Uncharacterized protein n=1 Tax=Caerostris darwini TaxID=1538125 RepID=A0AAV4NK53_9ARAC|nr:hypothetical protein CDAR_93831 [Caerostris darwini]
MYSSANALIHTKSPGAENGAAALSEPSGARRRDGQKNLQRKLNSPASHCFNLLFAVGIVTGQTLQMRVQKRGEKKGCSNTEGGKGLGGWERFANFR